jgi:hypothetical protein
MKDKNTLTLIINFLIEISRLMVPVFIGFLLGLWGSKTGRKQELKTRASNITNILRAELFNELSTTVSVVDGSIQRFYDKKFVIDVDKFKIIYFPASEFQINEDVGILDSEVVQKFISYKQSIRAAKENWNYYLNQLQSTKKEEVKISFFTYLLGLNTVVTRGRLLFELLNNKYEFSDNLKIPEYKRELNFEDLLKIVNENLPENKKYKVDFE